MNEITKTVLKTMGLVISGVCIALIIFGIIVKNLHFDDGLTRKIKFLGIDFTVGSPENRSSLEGPNVRTQKDRKI